MKHMFVPTPQKEDTFASQLGAGMGQGFSQGFQSSMQGAQERALEEHKRQQKMQIIADIKNRSQGGLGGERGRQPSFREQVDPKKIEGAISQAEEMMGFKFTPEQKAQAEKMMLGGGEAEQEDPFAEAEMFAAVGEHDLTKVASDRAKSQIEERREQRKERTAKETKYYEMNEPKVIELANTQQNLEMEETRYDRLGELFKEQTQFPSPLTVGLFTKEGTLNDAVYSQLSPSAQEAVKLIVESTSGLKDTYGARITNFDLQTYLKKLPSLLNSPEGNERVLRDLKVINQLNQLHAKGVMDIFDEHGGTDKIPYSSVERIYKKRYGEQEKALRKQFVNPTQTKFDSLPSPQQYLGKKMRDKDTGELFISDGKEWKPLEQ